MAQIDELLELLNIIILSFIDNTITTRIDTIIDILTFVQDP
jgi:hypothetical protein